MIYPEFLKNGDTLGIPAPSAGICEKDFPDFDRSLLHLSCEGYTVKETASVRSGLAESAPPEVRGAEMNELLRDEIVEILECYPGDIESYMKIGGKNFRLGFGCRNSKGLISELSTVIDIKNVQFITK